MPPSHLRPVSVFVLSLVFGVTTPLLAQTNPALTQQIDALFTRFAGEESPGAAVLVIHEGEIVHRKGYGHANLEHGVPVAPTSVFDIASVSKQFGGWAIATLVERGEIALTDDIRRYLPELPDFGHPITIDHLIHHTGGIRDWPGTLAVAGWQMDDVISFEQILTMAENQRDLNFVPGAEYSYSNTGYNILARLVERVSGQTFRAWTHDNLFAPLGMHSTHFHDSHTEMVPRRVQGYTPTNAGFARVHNGLTALASSSLFTTVDDLATWARYLNTPPQDAASVVRRMQERGVLNDGDTIAYAFGQSIGRVHGADAWRHSGSWAGFRTVLLRIPSRRFAAIILSNVGNYNPSPVADRIAEIVLAADDADRDDDPPSTQTSNEQVVQIGRATLDAYTGTYRLGPAWLLTVTRRGEGLEVQATAEQVFPAQAVSEREFFVPGYDASIVFAPPVAGQADHLRYRGITAPRVDITAPSAVRLRDYPGRYYSAELGTEYTLRVEEGRLLAHHRRHGDIPLTPATDDEFRGGAWFFRGVEFDRDEAGAVTAFRVSNGRSRNLLFVRTTLGPG